MKWVEHWHGLPREAVEAPSLELFKTQWDTALSNLLQLTLLWVGIWTISRGAFPPHPFCDALIGVYKGFFARHIVENIMLSNVKYH